MGGPTRPSAGPSPAPQAPCRALWVPNLDHELTGPRASTGDGRGRLRGHHSDIRPPDIERRLVSPLAVVAKLQVGAVPRGLNRLATFVTSIGSGIPGRGRTEREIQGFGMAVGAPDHARLVAVAEAAERYSSADFLVSPVIWSTLADLDGPAIDVTRLP